MLRAEGEVRHGDLFLHAIIHAVNALVLKAREMQDCFADSFAGDGPGVNCRATDYFQLFDESRAFAELHRLNRRALSRGTGAEDNEIVTFHVAILRGLDNSRASIPPSNLLSSAGYFFRRLTRHIRGILPPELHVKREGWPSRSKNPN